MLYWWFFELPFFPAPPTLWAVRNAATCWDHLFVLFISSAVLQGCIVPAQHTSKNIPTPTSSCQGLFFEMNTFTLLVFASCALLINTDEGEKSTVDTAGQTVPRYIQELYDNFTKENSSVETVVSQATNSIRSLQNTAPGQWMVW